jgi:hypothetical protein
MHACREPDLAPCWITTPSRKKDLDEAYQQANQFSPWPWFSRSWKLKKRNSSSWFDKARALQVTLLILLKLTIHHLFQERDNGDWALEGGSF